ILLRDFSALFGFIGPGINSALAIAGTTYPLMQESQRLPERWPGLRKKHLELAMRRRRARSLPLLVVGLAFAAFCAPSLMASQTAGWSVVVANNAFVDHGKGDTAVPIAMG